MTSFQFASENNKTCEDSDPLHPTPAKAENQLEALSDGLAESFNQLNTLKYQALAHSISLTNK